MKIFKTSVNIFYEDTSSAGVVFYPSYLRFMERSKSNAFKELGWPLDKLTETDVLIPITKVSVNYYRPSKLGDELAIHVHFHDIERYRFNMTHLIYKGEMLICDGLLSYAVVDNNFNKSCLPNKLFNLLKEMHY